MARLRRLPPMYGPFALLTMCGPLLVMLVQGDGIHPSVRGLAFVALLLVALARRSVLAWGLLLIWNLFVTLAVAGAGIGGSSGRGGLLLPNALLLFLLGLVSMVMLLSPSMREHVGIRRSRTVAPRRTAI
ncbi:MAG: hypothetical protein ACYDA6_01250 [Solirubrobacteraceae bacterium]